MKNLYSPAISVRDLTIGYHNHVVVSGLTVNIPLGFICAIAGHNGSGKSTFVKSILGLHQYQQGTINIPAPIKDNIAYVGQKSSIDWTFPICVRDVVLMGCYHKLGFGKKPTKEDISQAIKILEQIDIKNIEHKQIAELSGGQQQRVLLARALMQQAELYIFDEPFTGIDTATQTIMLNIFKQLKLQGKTIIVVHHGLDIIQEHFDWILELNQGTFRSGFINELYPKEVINSPTSYWYKHHDLV